MQTILILIESGLVYLGFQVSRFISCWLRCGRKVIKVLTVPTEMYLVLAAHIALALRPEAYGFEAMYLSLAVSVGQTR